MGILDKTTLRVAATILFLAAIIGFCWLAAKPLIAFLFAMLFAYLLEPLILRVQAWTHRSRGLAIAIVYLTLVAALAILGLVIGPKIASEARHLAQTGPELYQKISSGNIALQVGRQRGWSQETQQKLQQFLAAHNQDVTAFIQNQAARSGQLAQNALWIALVPILAVFFLKDKSKFSAAAEGMVDERRGRLMLRSIISDLDEMLSDYVRAQLYLAVISGVVYTIALTALRVPYSFVLGTIGGLLEFIPVVGPLVAGALILAISFTMNYPHLLFVLVFLLIWRGLQDYVVSPRVLGGRVELHPLAALFGVLVGAEIGGVIGVYLAVPIMAGVRILWKRWHMYTAHDTVKIAPDPVAQ